MQISHLFFTVFFFSVVRLFIPFSIAQNFVENPLLSFRFSQRSSGIRERKMMMETWMLQIGNLSISIISSALIISLLLVSCSKVSPALSYPFLKQIQHFSPKRNLHLRKLQFVLLPLLRILRLKTKIHDVL